MIMPSQSVKLLSLFLFSLKHKWLTRIKCTPFITSWQLPFLDLRDKTGCRYYFMIKYQQLWGWGWVAASRGAWTNTTSEFAVRRGDNWHVPDHLIFINPFASVSISEKWVACWQRMKTLIRSSDLDFHLADAYIFRSDMIRLTESSPD